MANRNYKPGFSSWYIARAFSLDVVQLYFCNYGNYCCDHGNYCCDHWNLLLRSLEFIVEIAGIYCCDCWNLLLRSLEYIVAITGNYCCDQWNLLLRPTIKMVNPDNKTGPKFMKIMLPNEASQLYALM